MTPRQLISSSLRLLGVIATSEAPTANEANDALLSLNALIDSWSNESLMIPFKVRESFPLVVNQQLYTFGPSGDFDSPRPLLIENALINPASSAPTLELAMKILNKDQWANIIVKGTTSTFPLWLYMENQIPQAEVQVWPIPTAACNLILYSWKPLGNFATLDVQMVVQPGSERMMKYNLAVELAAEYGKPVDPSVLGIAISSKEAIMRMNTKPLYMSVDNALVSPQGCWNYLTGDTVG